MVCLLFGRCIKDLANECDASDNGGCWSKEYTVNGKKKTYSACKDNIDQYKVAEASHHRHCPCICTA